MKKEVKDTIIVELGKKLQEFPHFYLVDVHGLNAEATSELRRKCFKNDIKMVVVKNKLLHQAFETSDVDFSGLYGSLKAAYAEEGIYVGADKLDELVAIKSKNEVIAEIVALLQSPAKNVISALQSGGNTIHGVLKTLGERPE